MNARLDQARRILFAHGAQRIREHVISQKDIDREELLLEWFATSKGVVVLQSEKNEPGVVSYADWPLGHTFTELEAALK